MIQLSLIPALEAARQPIFPVASSARHVSPMAPLNRPTSAQVSYLKKLTRIRTDGQLARFVVRKLGMDAQNGGSQSLNKGLPQILTRQDFAKVIDMEVAEKRWAA